MNNPNLHNPQLEGEAFFWQGGETGVLLIHGMTATAAEVQPFAKKLLEHDFTVAGPLLPGHGTTPEELNRTPWTAWVDSAERVYQRLRQTCSRVLIGGESVGGVISLYLASQHPEIPVVLLYAPAIRLHFTPFQQAILPLLAQFVPSVPKGSLDSSNNWQGYRVNPLKAALQLVHLQKEVMKRLPLVKQPLLVVQGRHDTTINPRSGEIILESAGSKVKELHWFENSAHTVLLDIELDAITELSLKFIHDHI